MMSEHHFFHPSTPSMTSGHVSSFSTDDGTQLDEELISEYSIARDPPFLQAELSSGRQPLHTYSFSYPGGLQKRSSATQAFGGSFQNHSSYTLPPLGYSYGANFVQPNPASTFQSTSGTPLFPNNSNGFGTPLQTNRYNGSVTLPPIDPAICPVHPFNRTEPEVFRPGFNQAYHAGFSHMNITMPTRGPPYFPPARSLLNASCSSCTGVPTTDMVVCADPAHEGNRRFHIVCAGISTMPPVDELWYCETCQPSPSPSDVTYFKFPHVLGFKFEDSDDEVASSPSPSKQLSNASSPTKERRKHGTRSTPRRRNPSKTPAPPPPRGTGAWSRHEEDTCIQAMKVVRGSYDGPIDRLWDHVAMELLRRGVNRSAHGIKNQWNRRLRELSGYDERVHANPERMTTGLLKSQKKAAKHVADDDDFEP